MEETSFEIEVPCDNDGYALFQCPHCGELFKVRPTDVENDAVLDIYCPACGLTSDNFLAQDVIDLALAKTANWAMRQIDAELRQLSKKSGGSGGLISIEYKSSHRDEPEVPIMPAIDSLTAATCSDCGRTAKVSPLLSMSVYICPFCGIGQFNER